MYKYSCDAFNKSELLKDNDRFECELIQNPSLSLVHDLSAGLDLLEF